MKFQANHATQFIDWELNSDEKKAYSDDKVSRIHTRTHTEIANQIDIALRPVKKSHSLRVELVLVAFSGFRLSLVEFVVGGVVAVVGFRTAQQSIKHQPQQQQLNVLMGHFYVVVIRYSIWNCC